MRRVISHFAILFGCLTLVVVGMLAYARRDDPADWVIFSVQAGNYNSGKVDIYRVLADGTHTEKLISSFDGYPNLWWMPSSPGWLTLYNSDLGGQRLQLIHLMGYTKLIIREPSTNWPTVHSYDRQHQRVYMTISDDWANNRTIWAMDLRTGERTPYELPLKLNNIRYQLGDEGFVYWSDYASAGDLYSVRFANLPQVTPLTTGGKVLQSGLFVPSDDWLYYYADDGNPDSYVHLYRIREDGSDRTLVAERVLIRDDALSFGSEGTETIYFWSGDSENPHLVQAKPDGSEAIDLPITPFAGWGMGWSPDKQWFYYIEEITDPNAGSPSSSDPFAGTPIAVNLRRINMQTGEDQLVWEGGRPYTLTWSTDGQTLLVVTDAESGYSYQKLYRMRPDGSETAVLVDNLRSSSLTQLADSDLVVLGTWGTVGSELHTLDLRTLEIRRLHEDAPPQ
ncbi:MAG: DUF5050 domain-containing protein, partial [Anaerolineae bacterium]